MSGYYNVPAGWRKSLQQLDFEQKISWKRGQLSVRDDFSYLPEGNFGGAYGSLGSQGIATLGDTSFGAFFGGSNLGTSGTGPAHDEREPGGHLRESYAQVCAHSGGRIWFHALLRNRSGRRPRSSGSSQISAQVGYDRILTPHTQVALVYGYQGFRFFSPRNGFHSHVVQGMYGHRISGRMDLLLGAGPQITLIDTQSADV